MLVQHVHVAFPVMAEMIDDMERTGEMPPLCEGSFNGYLHTPAELREEIRESTLAVESLVGVEGIAFALSDLDDRMNDPEERALLLGGLRAVESVPDLLGLGPHLLASTRKSSGMEAHARPPSSFAHGRRAVRFRCCEAGDYHHRRFRVDQHSRRGLR